MIIRPSKVAIAAALAVSACADLPSGPALSYEQLLPMTHENPKWARSAWQTQMQQQAAQQAAEPQQPVQAAPAPPAQPPASAPASPR